MRAAALFGLLVAGPAGAFDIDYAAVMAAHESEIRQVSPDQRELVLPGPVVVIERRGPDGAPSWLGIDQTPLGAAGCLFEIMTDLAAIAALCPDTLDDEGRERFGRALGDVAAFVGANTVPPVPAGDLPARLGALLAERTEAARVTLVCPGDPAAGAADRVLAQEITGYLGYFSSRAFADGLTRALGPARLPVSAPCL